MPALTPRRSHPRFALSRPQAEAIAKAKQPFERIVLTKAEALAMFADNPFKAQIVQTKIPGASHRVRVLTFRFTP